METYIRENLKQTVLSIIYLLSDFFYSLIYFSCILTLLVAGFGMTVCWLGIPIVVFLFKSVNYFTQREVDFTLKFLPINIKGIDFNSYSQESMLNKFKLFIKDKLLWRYIAYHLLKLPVTMVTFTISISLVIVPLVLLTAPLLYTFMPYTFFQFEITTMFQAIITSILGLGLAIAFADILNKLALKQGFLLINYLEG